MYANQFSPTMQSIHTKLILFKKEFQKNFIQQLKLESDIAAGKLKPNVEYGLLNKMLGSATQGIKNSSPYLSEPVELAASLVPGGNKITEKYISPIINKLFSVPNDFYKIYNSVSDYYENYRLIEEAANINEYKNNLKEKDLNAIIEETGHEISRIYEYQISNLKDKDIEELAGFAVEKIFRYVKAKEGTNEKVAFSCEGFIKLLLEEEKQTLEDKINTRKFELTNGVKWSKHKIFTAVGLREEIEGGRFNYKSQEGTNPEKYGYRARIFKWDEQDKQYKSSNLDDGYNQIASGINVADYVPLYRLVTKDDLEKFLIEIRTRQSIISFNKFFNINNPGDYPEKEKIAVFRDIRFPEGNANQQYDLQNVDFSSIDLMRMQLKYLKLQECNFDSSNMLLSEIISCNMERNQLKDVDLRWSILKEVEFGYSELKNAKFDNAFIDERTNLKGCSSFASTSTKNTVLLTDQVDDEVLANFYINQRWEREESQDIAKQGEELRKYEEALKNDKNLIFDNSKAVTIHFRGRDEFLQQMHSYLNVNIAERKIYIIGGLPGSGKTQTALKYINKFKDEYNNRVRWINAESKTFLNDSFRKFAKELGLDIKEMNSQEILLWVKKKLAERLEKTLLVFDNVEDPELLKKYLPKVDGAHHVIITTNKKLNEWESGEGMLGYEIQKLSGLEPEDAFNFVKNIVKDANEEDSKDLAGLFGNMPLGLSQSLAYIDSKKITIRQYINKHQETLESGQLPEEYLSSIADDQQEYGHIKNIYASLLLNLNSLKEYSSKTFEIIKLCSYLAAENIPIHLFESWFNNEEEKKAIISVLKGYSLADLKTNDVDTEFFDMHRFVQDTIREKTKAEFFDSLQQTMGLVHNKMEDFTETWNSDAILKKNKPLIEHAISLINHFNKAISDNREIPENNKNGLKVAAADLDTDCGNFYLEMRYINQALASYERALNIYEETHGNKDSKFINALLLVGFVYFFADKHQNALENYNKATDICINELDRDDPLIARVLFSIAQLDNKKGLPEDALPKLIKVLDIRKNKYGEEHPSVALILVEIGNTYTLLAQYKNALDSYNQALVIVKKKYGNEHAHIAMILNYVGNMHYFMGNNQEALRHYNKVLEIKETKHGKESIAVAITRNNIGCVNTALGKYEEAEKELKEILKKKKKAWGDMHSSVVITIKAIGENYQASKEYDKSLIYYKQALTIFKNVYGDEHIETIGVVQKIVDVNYIQRQDINLLEGYKQQYEQILESYKGIKAKGHDQAAKCIVSIGNIHTKQGKLEEALKNYDEAIKIFEKCFGNEHPELVAVLFEKSNVLQKLDRNQEAATTYKEALRIKKINDGEYNPKIENILYELGKVYLSLKSSECALHYLNQALEIVQNNPNGNSPNTNDILDSIEIAVKTIRPSCYMNLEFNCIIACITEIRYDNPLLNLLSVNKKDRIETVSALTELINNKDIEKDIINATTETVKLEPEVSTSRTSDIIKAIDQIKDITGENQLFELSGFYQYVFNALSHNACTKSAQQIIKALGGLANSLENILYISNLYEEYGVDLSDQITIILTQLEDLFEFVASGQIVIGSAYRPPYYDPAYDHNGNSGGGNGGGSSEVNNLNAQESSVSGIPLVYIGQTNHTTDAYYYSS